MENTKALLIAGLAGLMLFASTARGSAPMGPPMALLGEGHWGVGAEYGHDNINLEANGSLRPKYTGVSYDFDETIKIEDLAMSMFFATLGYGICDNWDVFLRLGAADAKDGAKGTGNIPINPHDPSDFVDVPSQTYSLGNLDSNFGFAWGLGTRATFARSGPWTFGGLAQATWFKPGDSSIRYTDPLWGPGMGTYHVGAASLDIWEAQVSLAVGYQVDDTLRFWAGPFLQFVTGNFDRSGDVVVSGADTGRFKTSSDLQQASEFGGHFGVDWGFSKQADLWVEGQVTGDSWFVGVGLIFRPQETFGM